MSILREFIGPFIEVCEKYLGIRIDPLWGEVIVGLSVLIVFSLAIQNIYLWIRRRLFGDISALPEEQLAMINLIARDVKGIKDHIEQVVVSLDTSIGGKLEEALAKTREAENDNVDEATAENGTKAAARMFIASRVKEVVIEKFLEGSCFVEEGRHQFGYETYLTDRTPIRFRLMTPYRERADNEHLDYVLEIWVAGGKVFNLEWGREWQPWLRYLRVGKWVDDVTSWKLGPIETDVTEKRVAAE